MKISLILGSELCKIAPFYRSVFTGREREVPLQRIRIVDGADETLKQEVIGKSLKASDLFSEKALNRKFREPLNLAAAMVRVGDADCLAAGISHTTA